MSHIATSVFDVAGISIEAPESVSSSLDNTTRYHWQHITLHTATGDAIVLTLHLAPGYEGLTPQKRSEVPQEQGA